MMKATLLFLICTFCSLASVGQTDSIEYVPGKVLEDAVYLTHDDFRHYRGIKKARIISNIEKDQLEFLSKVMFEEKFSYEADGASYTVESKKAWGYMQNGTLYVNYNGDFYRVPVFGSVSYLVANVIVVNPGFYDPRFGMSTGTATTKEIREFLMNYYDGILKEFTIDAVEQLLQRDPVIYAEFDKLSNRRKKEQAYGFIRRYNAAHPVYFLR